MSWRCPARRTAATSAAGRPSVYGGRLGERGHVAGVPEREWALEVDEVADGGQQGVEAGLVQPGLGVGGDATAPGPTGRRPAPGRAPRASAVKASTTVGSRWPPRRLLAIAIAPCDAVHPLDAPRPRRRAGPPASRSGCPSPAAPRGQPAAVVALEREGQRPLDVRAEAEVPGQRGRRGAVGVDQAARAGRARPASAWPSRAPAAPSARRGRRCRAGTAGRAVPDQSTR